MESSMKLKSCKIRKQCYRRKQLRKISNLLRYVEMCVVFVLISRLIFMQQLQLPLSLNNTTEYHYYYYYFLLQGGGVSPHLVFIVGNIIIITLFAQSGYLFLSPTRSSEQQQPPGAADLYLEFLQNSNNMYQNDDRKKLILGEKNKKSRKVKREYRRCKSEMRGCESEMKGCGGCVVLTRCVSENNVTMMGKSSDAESSSCSSSFPEDGMSNDEFRHTVEAFIARQQRLRLRELQQQKSATIALE